MTQTLMEDVDVESLPREQWRLPFYDVETRNSILSPYGVQITAEDGHSHTGTASAGGGHIAAPLIGLWVISGQERHKKVKMLNHERFNNKKNGKRRMGTLHRDGAQVITSPRSWGTKSRRDLPPHTASHPEHWRRRHIASYSSTPPSSIHWSGGHNVPHWKWRHRCTNHQLQDKEEEKTRHEATLVHLAHLS